MELVHRFTLPLGVEAAWEHFNDIGSVAQCFPGATVTSSDDDGFAGSVKVRVGPIALLYNGSGTFTERDAAAHRMVIEAKGKDRRGNGTAGAHVVLTMTAVDGTVVKGTEVEGTEVEVTTDLAITGKPAQFGRGVMQDVSDRLLGQFVTCLEQRHQPPAPTPSAPPPSVEQPAAAQSPVAAEPESRQEPAVPEAIDLGGALLPVLLRTYGPWLAAAAVAALAIVLGWRRRR